jgi:CRISPR-associated endoribonuclease Cas6
MRIQLHLSPKPGEAVLPIKFHHLIGAAIYNLLGDDKQHNSNAVKLFCTSPPLWGNIDYDEAKMRLNGDGYIAFCSIDTDHINRLFSKSETQIGGNLFDIFKTELIDGPLFQDQMTWRIHPRGGVVTALSELGQKHRVEFVPTSNPKETIECLERNLRYKWSAVCKRYPKKALLWSGVDDPETWLKDQKIQIAFPEPDKLRVITTQINQTTVKGWKGTVSITAPLAIQRLIWSCGLGQKTACGLGFAKPL